jgi:hypothetical protein
MSIYPPTGTLEIKDATLKIPVIDLQYTSNTAKIEANSNVVTEFQRSKKLIKYPRVALTSASQTVSGYEGHFVSQTTGSKNGTSNRQAWALFDNVLREKSGHAGPHFVDSTVGYDSNGDYTRGDSLGGVSGDWAYIRLPDKIQLQSVDLWARYDSQRNPIDATVLGSLNGTNWNVIGSWTGATFTAGESTSFTINSIQYYDYIGFVFEKIEAGSSGTYVNIHEIELYGTPEYDPEADGTDVTVKSYPNVPNTDWLEVYYDAKGLSNGAVSSPISGLGGTTISATKLGDPQVSNDAFVFDGSGDAIVSGATSLSGNPPLSYSVWFKTNSISSGSNSIVMIGYADNTEAIGFRINSTGYYRFYVYGGAINESITTTIVPELGIWTHATVVYDGLNSKLYIDGQFALHNTNTTTNLALASGAKIALGNYIDSNGALVNNGDYDGSIANFRLFNRALTSDEIYQLYAYQKEYFGLGALGMTLKAGRLGIGTSEPRAALDVRGRIMREYNPGEIIETIQGKANGRYVKVQSGTYLLPNVDDIQDLTSTHTRINGSNFDYTPPPGTTRVIYEFWFFLRRIDDSPILHVAGRVDGSQVNDARHTFRHQTDNIGTDPQIWIYNHMCVSIGEVTSDNIAGGQVATWNGPRTIDFSARRYSGSFDARLHKTNHWDGSGADILVRPIIKITAIA